MTMPANRLKINYKIGLCRYGALREQVAIDGIVAGTSPAQGVNLFNERGPTGQVHFQAAELKGPA